MGISGKAHVAGTEANALPALQKGCVFDKQLGSFTVVDDLPMFEPEEGEVLLQSFGAAINPVDTMLPNMLQNLAGIDNVPDRYVAGVDGTGIVVRQGPGVTSPAIGTRVIYHKPTTFDNWAKSHGGFAEFSVMPADALVPVPKAMSDVTAAAIPCAAWTAFQIVDRKCQVKEGDAVLVYGASGGTGSFVTQFAKIKQAKTIIAVCSGANAEYVLSLGATHVVDYKTEDVDARVKEIVGDEGVRVAVDLVGHTDSVTTCCNVLSFNGVLCPAATPEGLDASPLYDVIRDTGLHGKAASVCFVGFGGGHFSRPLAPYAEMMDVAREATEVIASAQLQVEVSQTVSLDDMPAALERAAKMGTRGKVVLEF